MSFTSNEIAFMQRALELAKKGRGLVEPNPMVGCVIASGGTIVGEGFHSAFGQDHAEVEALQMAARRASGTTMFVTLEPCCHQGKTPPCTQAIIAAGVSRVIVATVDPFGEVDGGGIAQLRAADIDVQVGLLEEESRALNAPYFKLITTRIPWVIAKWAMTIDGKIATASGDSRWISGEASRALVHKLRGRIDAILVGSGTANHDDPLLTARPPGPRTATRIVVDSQARLSPDSQLVRTARNAPVLVAAATNAPSEHVERLTEAGCEVLKCEGTNRDQRLEWLLTELGRRNMTNVLVEGGSKLLSSLFLLKQIDEVHVYIATKIIGCGISPLEANGFGLMSQATPLERVGIKAIEGDIHIHGFVGKQV